MLRAPPFRTAEINGFLRLLGICLQAAEFPRVRFTSWWRDRAENARVGGHPNSQHLTGLAVDVAQRGATEGVEAFIAACEAVGLVVIDEGDHWHIQRYAASAARGLCCGAAVSVAG